MILRSLEIEGFRCFDRAVVIDDFGSGLNVISGPNGAGKSTLLSALRHVLVDAHSLSGALVRQAMMPWGRELSPRIRVVLEHGGEEWRLEKRFLTSPSARLERRENGVFRPIAEGREAEARARAILMAEAAPRGLATESHLGLLQVLWTPQGPPALPAWSPGVRTTLQDAMGSALSSPAGERLSALVDKRHGDYFTPTGKIAKSSPVAILQQQATLLARDLADLETQWRNAARNRDELATERHHVVELTEQLGRERPKWEQAQVRQRETSELTHAELQSRHRFEGLLERLARWRQEIAAEHQLRQQVEAAEAELATARTELAAAEALQPQIQKLEAELAVLYQDGLDAKAWPDWLRIQVLDTERAVLRAEMAGIAAPEPAALSDLRKLHQSLQVSQAGLAAASLRLIIEAETPFDAEFEGDTRSLSPGTPLEFVHPTRITFRVPGVAKFTAESANPQAANLAGEVDELSRRLQALSKGEPLGSIEERAARRDALRQLLERKELEARPLELRKSEFLEISVRHPEWASGTPDIQKIREQWKACKDAIDVKKGLFQLQALSAAEGIARTTAAERQRELSQITARLAQYAAGPGLEELESQRNAEQTNLALARARLAELGGNSPADLEGLGREVGNLEMRLAAARESAARLEGELASTGSRNLYTRLSESEEALADISGQLARQSRRASALQLLKSTLAESAERLTAALPEQIAQYATANWRHIAGEGAPTIRIDSSWKPVGLEVPNASAALVELSGGEAEQVAFATRLALASQLAISHRQLAVFDDAFLATDPHRAARILDLLAAAAEQLQIIVLTCHPERYRDLPAVRHFDLEKLKE